MHASCWTMNVYNAITCFRQNSNSKFGLGYHFSNVQVLHTHNRIRYREPFRWVRDKYKTCRDMFLVRHKIGNTGSYRIHCHQQPRRRILTAARSRSASFRAESGSALCVVVVTYFWCNQNMYSISRMLVVLLIIICCWNRALLSDRMLLILCFCFQ